MEWLKFVILDGRSTVLKNLDPHFVELPFIYHHKC